MASAMTNSNSSNPFMVTGLQAHVMQSTKEPCQSNGAHVSMSQMQSTKEPCQSNGAHVNMSQIPMKRANQIRPNNMSTSAWDLKILHVVFQIFFLYVLRYRQIPKILQKGWRQQALKGHAGVALP